MNEMAKVIAKLEGGKKQVDIAQIKEVLRHLADTLNKDCTAMRTFGEYLKYRTKKIQGVKNAKNGN